MRDRGNASSSAPAGTSGSTGIPAGSSDAAIAAAVSPGIVDINTTLGYRGAQAAGTGMVLTSSGEVLTNNHVIEGATSITATDVGSGQTYTASVVGYDPSEDVAVLQLTGASGLQTVTIGDSSAVRVGQRVVGIGNAGGTGGTPSYAGGS
ncbi:MAG: S1C family serine protease, partial [Frankiaceae bacterium]